MTEARKDYRLDFKTAHWSRSEHYDSTELEAELKVIAKLLPMLQPGESITVTRKHVQQQGETS